MTDRNRIDFIKLHELRRELGQRKYGRGRENAGFRRDNARDVLEELSDAIVIAGYWETRARESGHIQVAARVEYLAQDIMDMMLEVNNLRDITPIEMKEETGVERFPPTEEVLHNEKV